MIFGAWSLIADSDLNEILNLATNNKIISAFVILLGLILVIFGIFGCVGGLYDKRLLLFIYLFTLIFLITLELAIIVFGISKQENMLDVMKLVWENAHQATRDYIQSEMNCCGFDSPDDYKTVLTNLVDESPSTPDSDTINNRPGSCGGNVGCKEPLKEWFNSKKFILGGVGVGILVLQFTLLGVSIFLIKKINREVRVKRAFLRNRLSNYHNNQLGQGQGNTNFGYADHYVIPPLGGAANRPSHGLSRINYIDPGLTNPTAPPRQ